MTRPDRTGPDPPQRPSREQAAGGDQRPSPGLQVAAMLARAGWPAERLVRAFGLPPAFAEALHRDAIATGERRPGDDARLAEALRPLQARQRQTRTQPEPVAPDVWPGAAATRCAPGPGRSAPEEGAMAAPAGRDRRGPVPDYDPGPDPHTASARRRTGAARRLRALPDRHHGPGSHP